MQTNKFLKTLAQLSSKDIKTFHKYSDDLYHSGSAANKLLSYLKKYHPNFEQSDLDERMVFKRIFKGENFNKLKLSKAISKLRARLKEYLLWQHLQKPSLDKDFLLLKIYEERNLDELAKKQLKEIDENLAKNQAQDLWYWMNQLRFAHQNYFNVFLEKIAPQSPKIEEVMNQLENFYGIAKLQYTCELLERAQVINEAAKQIPDLEEILTKDWNNTSVLHICYQAALRLILDKTDENYYDFKKQVINNLQQFDERNEFVLMTYLVNYCAFRIKSGNQFFANELFEIYQIGIDNQSFIINEYFDDMHFGNIVDAGCSLRKHQWSENFINDWKSKLVLAYQEEVVNCCRAFIFYEREEYHKAYQLLTKDFKKNLFFSIKAKRLELVCLFELKSDFTYDFIMDRCNAFSQFLRRNELIHESLRKGMFAFIKYFRKILNPITNKDKFLKQLNGERFILYKSWLITNSEKLK